MSFVPMNSITCVTPWCERTSRSSRSMPGVLVGGGWKFSRVTVLPPMPSLTMALCIPSPLVSSSARRTASQSSQRSWALSVEHEPSVMESPKATIVPMDDEETTSIAFNQNMDVVVPVKGVRVSSAAISPELFALNIRRDECSSVLARPYVDSRNVEAHSQVLPSKNRHRHRIALNAATRGNRHARGAVEERLSVRARCERRPPHPLSYIRLADVKRARSERIVEPNAYGLARPAHACNHAHRGICDRGAAERLL